MTPLKFHPSAIVELDETADYYEARVAGLGRAFRDKVAWACQRIRANPTRHAPIPRAGYRRCRLPRFRRYTVVFLALDDCVWIAAIAHDSRRPGYWKDRRP